MDLDFNFFSLILVGGGMLTFVYAVILLRISNMAIRWIGLMMLANSFFCTGYGLELALSDLEQIKTILKIEYIGITVLPVTWFLFCMKIAGRERWYQKRSNFAALIFIPAMTLLLMWTNDYHHLYYKDFYFLENTSFSRTKLVPGPGYILYNVYFYALFAVATWILIVGLNKTNLVFKRQKVIILLAAAVPIIANFVYLLDFEQLEGVDVTPFAFLVSTVMVNIGVFNLRIFDVLPVAREKVLELMQDGFMILDRNQYIIDCNAAFKQYVEQKGELVGRTVAEVFPNQPSLIAFLEAGGTGKLDLQVVKDTAIYDLEADVRSLENEHFKRKTTIVKFQDQTALKRESLKIKEQSEELKELNGHKDLVLSIIAHDLRGPLVNLSEVLRMVREGSLSMEEFEYLVPTLSRDISYTKDLLENILHWSRSQLKGHGIKQEYINLSQIVRDEIAYHTAIAMVKDVTLENQLSDEVAIYADSLMIQIVVRNLLNNAIKFSNKYDTIAVYMSESTDMINLYIKDTGKGMPADVLASIFHSAQSTRGTMGEKGTGLGLRICRDFIESNGGTISVDSEQGKGTVFKVTIPRADGIIQQVTRN